MGSRRPTVALGECPPSGSTPDVSFQRRKHAQDTKRIVVAGMTMTQQTEPSASASCAIARECHPREPEYAQDPR